jgi:hypothetical protein
MVTIKLPLDVRPGEENDGKGGWARMKGRRKKAKKEGGKGE